MNQNTTLFYTLRRPKDAANKPPLLIMLHGVGSNEQHMFSLAEAIPDKYLVVSARGPLSLGAGSYAWFQVDFSSGRPEINAQQAEQSRLKIISFIDKLKSLEDFDDEQVFLMGFSQGGIMSYSVALTAPEKIAGIAVMSGRLLPEVKPLIAGNDRLEELKIFVSHGKSDNVLNYQYAVDAVDYLKGKNIHPEFHTYEEGHTINSQMLQDVVKWLK